MFHLNAPPHAHAQFLGTIWKIHLVYLLKVSSKYIYERSDKTHKLTSYQPFIHAFSKNASMHRCEITSQEIRIFHIYPSVFRNKWEMEKKVFKINWSAGAASDTMDIYL